MVFRSTRLSFALVLSFAGTTPLAAQCAQSAQGARSAPVSPDAGCGPSWFVGATYLDIEPDGNPGAAIEVALDSPAGWLRRVGWTTGLMVSARGEAYVYAGVHLPVPLPLGVTARPSFAFGLYRAGQGIELGSLLEFRSALAFDRQLVPGVAVTLSLYHLSNAGLGSRNPGVEALGVGLSLLP